MRNLFLLLWRHQFFTLFIVLEIISISLLTSSLSYQRSLRYNTMNDVTGSLYSGYHSVTNYFGLQSENEKLVLENATLRTMLSQRVTVLDTTLVVDDTLYRYVPALVVSSTVSKKNNLIMVNRGTNDGVTKEMGAISSRGIVGIVIGTSKNYAVIMSMLHTNMRISARVKKNNQLVNVEWNQPDYLFGTVTDIPSHLQLKPGDSIITSGNSLIFPKDILIGRVEKHQKEIGEHLGSAMMKFSTDFNSLKHVYLIENYRAAEQDSLFTQIQDQ